MDGFRELMLQYANILRRLPYILHSLTNRDSQKARHHMQGRFNKAFASEGSSPLPAKDGWRNAYGVYMVFLDFRQKAFLITISSAKYPIA